MAGCSLICGWAEQLLDLLASSFVGQSLSWSIRKPTSQLSGWSVRQLGSQSVSTSISQSVSQSVSLYITLLRYHSLRLITYMSILMKSVGLFKLILLAAEVIKEQLSLFLCLTFYCRFVQGKHCGLS